jgi:hypothetical protein
MGNCGSILCSKENSNNILTNSNAIISDIVIHRNVDKNELIKKYTQIPYINKVIYLQNKIRNFLKKNKSKTRNKKNNSNKKLNKKIPKNESKVNNNSTLEEIKLNKNKEKERTNENTTDDSNKINKKDYENNIEADEDDFMKVEKINPHLMNSNLKDAFKKNERKSFLENDPRDAPIDDIRRYFPKINEDQSSYEGEWKNGMRD